MLLVKSALKRIPKEFHALLVNTQLLALPFALTALQESSAQVAALRAVVLAATALLDLIKDANHAQQDTSAQTLTKHQSFAL